MWPHWAQRRRWNHQPAGSCASQSAQPGPLGWIPGTIPLASLISPAPSIRPFTAQRRRYARWRVTAYGGLVEGWPVPLPSKRTRTRCPSGGSGVQRRSRSSTGRRSAPAALTLGRDMTTAVSGTAPSTGHLRRDVGFWGLMFVSLGSIIGSGWLLGALTAAEVAGPAAILSWALGAIM